MELSKNLPVWEMPVAGLNLCNLVPGITNMNSFVDHMKKVNDCSLEFPIILDEEGFIIDGRHRVARALLLGTKTIKFVRFEKNPEPCSHMTEES